jgi:oligosaccharide repeat unit polymerase
VLVIPIAAFVFAIILVLILVQGVAFPMLWILAIVLIAVGVVPIVGEVRNRAFDVMNIRNAFIAVFVLEYGVWTIYMLSTGDTRFRQTDPANSSFDLGLGLIYAIISLLAFHGGYYSKSAARLSTRKPRIAEWDWTLIFGAAFAFILIGLTAFYLLMRSSGGIASYVAQLGYMRSFGLRGSSYLVMASTTLVATATSLIYMAAIRRRSVLYLCLTIAGAVTFSAAGLIIGFRNSVVLGFIELVAIRHFLKKPVKLSLATVVVAFLVAAGSNLYSVSRDSAQFLARPSISQVLDTATNVEFWQDFAGIALGRFHGIESFAIIMDGTAKGVPHGWGWQSFLDIVTSPIPRTWWPDKPLPLGIYLTDTFYFPGEATVSDGVGGIPPSWLGELYWNFHIPGILIGSFILGMICRAWYQFVLRNRESLPVVLLYSSSLGCLAWMVEAPTLGFEVLLTIWIPILIVLAVAHLLQAGLRSPAHRSSAPSIPEYRGAKP